MLGGDLCKHLVNLLAAGVMTGAGPLRYGIWSVDCVMVVAVAVTLMTDAECSPALLFLFPVILITSCLFLTSPSILLTCILKLQSKNLIALHI